MCLSCCNIMVMRVTTLTMRVLIVEDDTKIATYLKRGLQEQGYAVDAVANGNDALDWMAAAPYDMIVLDLMLPGLTGLAVCREMRQRGLRTPVLMLTARDAIEDRVAGLDVGADDYLVKPFALSELLARMRALLRRASETPKTTRIQVGDLALDTATHRVTRQSQTIDLTAKEYSILEYLMREAGRVVTRDMISNHVWNFDDVNQSNVVDVYIRNLRRKIDDPFEVKLIQTLRGLGYQIAA